MEDIKIRLSRFCHQNENCRTKYTLMHGNLLATVIEKDFSFHLYEVDGFLAELVFNKQIQKVESINPVHKAKRLNRFLKNIHLDKFL